MGQDTSNSMIGYLTAYICARKDERMRSRRVWNNLAEWYRQLVQLHWGW